MFRETLDLRIEETRRGASDEGAHLGFLSAHFCEPRVEDYR